MKGFWICMLAFFTIVLSVKGATQHLHLRAKPVKQHHQSTVTQQHKPAVKHQAFGNQRIIKIHGTPQVNNFNGHHKHVRNRPVAGFPKGYTKEDFVVGQKHHALQSQQQTSFFHGPSTNHIKHLSRPPPHVYHKLTSYGSGFPYKTANAFRSSLPKPPFRSPNLSQVRPTTVKQTAQNSHVTQKTPVSSVSTKTTSASASYYSPTFTSFSYGSGPAHPIIQSNDNNGPIREVPAPDLSLKSSGGGLSLGGGHLTSHVTAGLFTGFKDSSGSLESVVTTPSYDTILKTPGIDVGSLVKSPPIDVSHFLKTSFDGFSNGASFTGHGKGHGVDVSTYDQESSVDISNLFKGGVEAEKPSSSYEVSEHHHIPSNDHVIKSNDGTKLYYAPDPDPSLPVYKVPPTKDPYSTPSHGQSIESIYIPQISNGYSYIQGGNLGGTVTTLTSEELYQLMQGYPTVLSHAPQPAVGYVGQPQSNTLTTGSEQNYYHQSSSSGSSSSSSSSSSSASEIGDITQYLQNPEIHNLLHNTHNYHYAQDSSHSPAMNYATQVRPAVYSPQNTQYQNYFQIAQYKPFSYASKSVESTGPQTFDTSENDHDYEPEASESRNTATVIRQTKEGTVGASDKDSLPEDSDSNDLNFSVSEEPEVVEDEPQVYHFKNIPEVPFYSSLPNEEAAKTLAGLQAAGSVASDFLNNVKAMRGDQEPRLEEESKEVEVEGEGPLIIEEVAGKENAKNMGFYQFSGFKKLDESKTENIDAEDVTEAAEEEEQVATDESNGNYSAVRQIVSTYSGNKGSSSRREPEKPRKDSEELQSEELANLELKESSSNHTFGKRIRPK